ncbi:MULTISPECIES: LysR family transcriptional regulator [Pseudoxanthomonas]|uniref:DNA-binding transcriptional LysR family regulator n=1 Tax=Pseudoxanthomonas winnipegensis TaxID=2480810 RepID=A0AAW8GAZ0_9GAMM|nr:MULTISPECIES: LysR family transcriptional regulator [Pseudoxanthomonas]MDQ1119082.1 DNA-binding transcriptional LysR family regulator [Pseudoxanthomonas winnipegensis]MDQ1132272.1 DNA-binding transcriptional LysR family regulator [Pseudoxanthomonas winnipegensis]MDR6137715.1 DNA-binding transcriptional LysR family regulator [Pseudoxanthomonas sp. SORGH_AS_0997]
MELRHVRYFLALAEELNFTRAAARVGIAQPPFSSQIKDLEQELGTQLFHRIPQGAELTSAGLAFLSVVQVMPELAEQAARAAKRAARGEVGALNIGFTASSAFNAVVPRTIRAFRRAYPDVRVNLEEANSTRLVSGLDEGTLDVVFLRPNPAVAERFQLRALSEEPLVVALPDTHPAAAGTVVALKDIAADPLLLFPRAVGPTLYDTIVGAFRNIGCEPSIGLSAPQIASVINLVASAFGIALVPACMSQLAVQGVAYRQIDGEAPVARIALATRRGETASVVRNFLATAIA